ncbi:MAG: ribose 5-phosphate isomerase B [Actinobacteria bacterium HGW-Actinobacteria-9]|jgi:ribose 5-phosphate isomerase B|nr:MAG: ribose 5-phosphate isomerase B [Actinobacteria bacterium HGW-Actinobacteria-9]
MRVAIGSDHAGFDQKERLKAHLAEEGFEIVDMGTESSELSVDYPDYAEQVARAVATGTVDRGVLVCGTGIGMAMAANKVDGVRAANVTDPQFARLAREHNDANVVAVSGRFVPEETNVEIVDAFLGADFEGERHKRRIDKINGLEK